MKRKIIILFWKGLGLIIHLWFLKTVWNKSSESYLVIATMQTIIQIIKANNKIKVKQEIHT